MSIHEDEFLKLIERVTSEADLMEAMPSISVRASPEFCAALITLIGNAFIDDAYLFPAELELFTKYHDETIAYAKLTT